MSTKIQAPNKRVTQPSIGNPLFVTDIQNANEDLLFYVNMLLGLPNPGFAILQGFTYNPSSGGSYSSGYVYLNGQIYYFAGTLSSGNYLNPTTTLVAPKLFGDGNSYSTYEVFTVLSSSSPVSGCPLFTGDMNAYRFNMTDMIGTTTGKIPVIGASTLSNNKIVLTDGSGNLISSTATLGTTAGNVPVIGSEWTRSVEGNIRLAMVDTDGTIISLDTYGGAMPITMSMIDGWPKYLRTKSDYTVEQRENADVLSDLNLYSQNQLGGLLRKLIVPESGTGGEFVPGAYPYSFGHGLTATKIMNVSVWLLGSAVGTPPTFPAKQVPATFDATAIYFNWPSEYIDPTVNCVIDYLA